MAYALEGRLLEVCTCKAICPCWVGEDPDGGTCEGTLAWHFEQGTIDGVDVSGLTFGMLAHIPGNVLKGHWRAMAFVDERASAAQESAILSVFTGKQGGSVADLAQLVGEVLSVERVPIVFEVDKGRGRFRMGGAVEAGDRAFAGCGGAVDHAHRRGVLVDPRVAGVRRQGAGATVRTRPRWVSTWSCAATTRCRASGSTRPPQSGASAAVKGDGVPIRGSCSPVLVALWPTWACRAAREAPVRRVAKRFVPGPPPVTPARRRPVAGGRFGRPAGRGCTRRSRKIPALAWLSASDTRRLRWPPHDRQRDPPPVHRLLRRARVTRT